jgi:hypothetical protein
MRIGGFMRCAVTAVLLAAAFAGACSTTKETKIEQRELARVPVAALTGLSRAELETALKLSTANRLPVKEARLEGEALITSVAGFRLTFDTHCIGGSRPSLMFEQGGVGLAYADFTFRDGRVEAATHWPTKKDDTPGEQVVTSTCSDTTLGRKAQSRRVAETIVGVPLLLPVAGLFSAINTVSAADINGALAKLPLGAAPPGGLDAYLADLPNGAVLKTREGASAEIEFRFHMRKDIPVNLRGTPDAVVHVVDGKVAKLVSGKDCVLTEKRAFSCDRGFP